MDVLPGDGKALDLKWLNESTRRDSGANALAPQPVTIFLDSGLHQLTIPFQKPILS